MCRKVYGMVRRFDWDTSKPRFLNESARYCGGGSIGIQKHIPKM